MRAAELFSGVKLGTHLQIQAAGHSRSQGGFSLPEKDFRRRVSASIRIQKESCKYLWELSPSVLSSTGSFTSKRDAPECVVSQSRAAEPARGFRVLTPLLLHPPIRQ